MTIINNVNLIATYFRRYGEYGPLVVVERYMEVILVLHCCNPEGSTVLNLQSYYGGDDLVNQVG